MAAPKEGSKKDLSLRDFGGMNTQPDRKMIGEEEFSWLENVMPIGHGNMRAVPAPSAALATLPAGEICYYMAEGNLLNVSYMFMFCKSGSCYQINLTTYAITVVGAAGVFSGVTTKIAQWKNERICIIDSINGYFDWNGTVLTAYKGTLTSIVTIVSGGINYTSSPTVAPATGSATFTSAIGIGLVTLVAAGTGYAAGDILTVVGGTSTLAGTISVSAVGTLGVITGINLTTPGIYTAAPANPASTTGGHGTGATFTLNFSVISVTVTNVGSGYTVDPVLNVTGGGGSLANVTANLAFNTSGTTIAVYSSRVWIGNNRTVVYTAPSSYNDFSAGNQGGSFVMTDDTLRSNITRLFSANSYLYVMGASSINIISNVTVTSPITSSTGVITSPSVTTFSNTNITPTSGTYMPDSVLPFSRSLLYAVDYGIMGLTGSSPQKISDNLDGLFQKVDFTQNVSSGLCVIFNILCMCFLVKYNDPTTGLARQIILVCFNKKWFVASQVSAVNFIATASPDSDVPVLWGTDGGSLYQLFANTSGNVAQTISTKLWDMGSPLVTKQALKLGVECISPLSLASITVNVDTDYNSIAYQLSQFNSITWTNNTGVAITWINNTGVTIIWFSIPVYSFLRSDANNVGNYIGFTLTSNSPNIVYNGLHLQYEARTPWVGVPW